MPPKPPGRRVVACGVRWGKTLCAAMEGLAAAMEPYGYDVAHSDARGETYAIARYMPDGTKEVYDTEGKLLRILDRRA